MPPRHRLRGHSWWRPSGPVSGAPGREAGDALHQVVIGRPPVAATLTVDADLEQTNRAVIRRHRCLNDVDCLDASHADLIGADLAGAKVTKVTRSNTDCPDGQNSVYSNTGSVGHLTAKR
jgi:hypothetical protein